MNEVCEMLKKAGTYFIATCAMCGGEARVPFQPKTDRPVYCSDCFAKIKAAE